MKFTCIALSAKQGPWCCHWNSWFIRKSIVSFLSSFVLGPKRNWQSLSSSPDSFSLSSEKETSSWEGTDPEPSQLQFSEQCVMLSSPLWKVKRSWKLKTGKIHTPLHWVWKNIVFNFNTHTFNSSFDSFILLRFWGSTTAPLSPALLSWRWKTFSSIVPQVKSLV